MTSVIFSESPLLRDAEAILISAGFLTRREYVAEATTPWLLAENEFFAIAVAVAPTLTDAERIEAYAAAELLRRVSAGDVGGKRWDAYLVILCEELVTDPEATRRLVELQYEMRGVRRLVATGVTDSGPVRDALRPFLPLPPPMPGGVADAFSALVDQLTLNGIDQTKAELYVAAYEASGDLDEI
jgi:hypothetical protein